METLSRLLADDTTTWGRRLRAPLVGLKRALCFTPTAERLGASLETAARSLRNVHFVQDCLTTTLVRSHCSPIERSSPYKDAGALINISQPFTNYGDFDMKVKDVLKAIEGAPDDADVSITIRALKVVAPKSKADESKKINSKPPVVKKPVGKAAPKVVAKPAAKESSASKTASKVVAKPAAKGSFASKSAPKVVAKKPAPVIAERTGAARRKAESVKKVPNKPAKK